MSFDLFKPLLTVSFWFDLTPPPLSPLVIKILFGFFAILVIGGAVLRIIAGRWKKDKHLFDGYRRIVALLLTMGCLGLVLFFFSYEQIQLFGAHFWYAVWGLVTIVWLVFIIRHFVKFVPAERERLHLKQEQMKYLPRQKRK